MPRVSIENKVHPFYADLTEKKQGAAAPLFRTMKDVFMLACAFGAKNGVRLAISKPMDIFDTNTFSEDDWSLLEAIALAENQDIKVLDAPATDSRSNADVLMIAEEYANAGIEKVRKSISPTLQGVDLGLALIEDGDSL